MFIGVQKLELFSTHKSLDLRQFLDLTGLQTSSHSGFVRSNGFDATFLANPSFGRLSARFKSFSFDAFGNISRLIAQRLG